MIIVLVYAHALMRALRAYNRAKIVKIFEMQCVGGEFGDDRDDIDGVGDGGRRSSLSLFSLTSRSGLFGPCH